MQNYNETALTFIQAQPNSTKNAIGDHLQLRGLPLFNLLKQMVNNGQIVANLDGSETTYKVIESTEEQAEPLVPPTEEQKTETATVDETEGKSDPIDDAQKDIKTDVTVESKGKSETATTKQAGRNTGTFKFKGTSYNKGKLIHAVVSDYVSRNNKITHDKLKEVFPDTLMKRFGIFQTVSKAREISGPKYDRYFFKEEMQIKLKDAVIVTCNQITSENLMPFLEVCAKLGVVIEAE